MIENKIKNANIRAKITDAINKKKLINNDTSGHDIAILLRGTLKDIPNHLKEPDRRIIFPQDNED